MQCRCFAFGNMHVITAYPLSSFGCFSCSKCQTGPLLNPFSSQWVSFFIIFYVPYLRWFISTCNIKTKIKKTDNCARACHLHQGATRRAAVDFRTNITCQCHYLNLLLCQSISWSLALHQPLYPPPERWLLLCSSFITGPCCHQRRQRVSGGEERPFLRNSTWQRRWSERRRPPGNISGRPASELSHECHGVQQEDQTVLCSAMFCSPLQKAPTPPRRHWPGQNSSSRAALKAWKTRL